MASADWFPFLHYGDTAMNQSLNTACTREPWNKGKLVGQKAPLRLKEIWAIRIRLH